MFLDICVTWTDVSGCYFSLRKANVWKHFRLIFHHWAASLGGVGFYQLDGLPPHSSLKGQLTITLFCYSFILTIYFYSFIDSFISSLVFLVHLSVRRKSVGNWVRTDSISMRCLSMCSISRGLPRGDEAEWQPGLPLISIRTPSALLLFLWQHAHTSFYVVCVKLKADSIFN